MNQAQTNRKHCNELILTGTNNGIKCSKGNSESRGHKLGKFWICNFCWENNLDFATEVTFTKGGRADIVIKDWKLALELLYKEPIQDFLKKSYPINTLPVSVQIAHDETMMNMVLNDLMTTNGETWEYFKKTWIGDDKLWKP